MPAGVYTRGAYSRQSFQPGGESSVTATSVVANPRSTDRAEVIKFELSRALTEGEMDTVLSRLRPHPCIKAVEPCFDSADPSITVTAWSSDSWTERDRKKNVTAVDLVCRV